LKTVTKPPPSVRTESLHPPTKSVIVLASIQDAMIGARW